MAFAAYRYQVSSQFIQSCFLCHSPNFSNFDFSLQCCNQGECSKPGRVPFLYAYTLHLILIPPSPVGSACVFIFEEKPRHREFTILFSSTRCFRGWASTTTVWLEEHCLRPSPLLLQDVFRSFPAASPASVLQFWRSRLSCSLLTVIPYAIHTQCCTTLYCGTVGYTQGVG